VLESLVLPASPIPDRIETHSFSFAGCAIARGTDDGGFAAMGYFAVLIRFVRLHCTHFESKDERDS
jgi:hypothetical protein